MTFALQLAGDGSYDLSNYKRFKLPESINAFVDVGYKPDSVAVQEDELRLAVELT